MNAAATAALLDRVRALEDERDLRALLVRGWRALDLRDWDTWIENWAPDAVLEFGPWQEVRGRDAIRRTVMEAEAGYAFMQHHILNVAFDVRGDRAGGIGYMWFVAVPEPGMRTSPYAMGGPYDWEFVRTEAGWRLARQRLGVWWETGEDSTGAFAGGSG
ncbi:nuclear transport factor 2 family protein [Streptomyces marincola]|uniref:nuclear transport factor 2 family protein n=1 Tax=Streptomyces marincola TaxID=2878388 RepID=UPI001CF0EA6B|nr:nuclear transport factor 2 family protein [Streptomyces marincola]UCM86456.1 nuclear transport factor 2 family protein [Streptomyces marincola]